MGQLHEIFDIQFFLFMNKSDSMAKNMLSSCGFKVVDFKKKLRLRNCGVAVGEQHFFKSCIIAIAEVLPSSCGLKKKLRVSISVSYK